MSLKEVFAKEITVRADSTHVLTPICFRGTNGIDCSDGYVLNYTLRQLDINCASIGGRTHANGAAFLTVHKFGTLVYFNIRPGLLKNALNADANALISLTTVGGDPVVIPVGYRPLSQVNMMIPILDNAAISWGLVAININGTISISGTNALGFTAGALSQVIGDICCHYPIEFQ